MATLSILERFMNAVSMEPMSGCWLWKLTCDDGGYARFRIGERMVSAHRLSHEMFVGPIPEGLDIDHLCRVRCCVNPRHIEAVTTRENILRGIRANAGVTIGCAAAAAAKNARTHCRHGHEFTPENTRYYTHPNHNSFRYCAACLKEANRRNSERRRHRQNP